MHVLRRTLIVFVNDFVYSQTLERGKWLIADPSVVDQVVKAIRKDGVDFMCSATDALCIDNVQIQQDKAAVGIARLQVLKSLRPSSVPSSCNDDVLLVFQLLCCKLHKICVAVGIL